MRKLKVIFFTNVLAPYRHQFFNMLSCHVDLTVVYRGEYFGAVPTNWHRADCFNYSAVFLTKGIIRDRAITLSGIKYIFKDYDFLFFTNYGYPTDIVNILAAIICRKRFFFEFDGLVEKKDRAAVAYVKRLIFKSACVLFSPNNVTDGLIRLYAPSASIYRYPFSSVNESEVVDINNNYKMTVNKYFRSKNGLKVLGVGQFIYRKGVDFFFQAAACLSDSDIEFLWVGSITNDEQSINRVCCPPNCRVITFQKANIVKKIMQEADVFLFPTREDVWGLVVNEAMANGLPVIGSKKSGSSSMIVEGHNGFLIEPNDCSLVESHLRRLGSDRELLRILSKNAVQTARSYTLETMLAAHLRFFKLYREIYANE